MEVHTKASNEGSKISQPRRWHYWVLLLVEKASTSRHGEIFVNIRFQLTIKLSGGERSAAQERS